MLDFFISLPYHVFESHVEDIFRKCLELDFGNSFLILIFSSKREWPAMCGSWTIIVVFFRNSFNNDDENCSKNTTEN